jgi:hypothetical protein
MATNRGLSTETFDATLYGNATNIAVQTLTLGGLETADLSFNLNTTGFAYGNYILKAYAEPVANESRTLDNTYIGSQVTITIPGDISGNLKIDLSDLVLLAQAYGSRTGNTRWNPNADIDGNGVVGLSDLRILALHFGQQYV